MPRKRDLRRGLYKERAKPQEAPETPSDIPRNDAEFEFGVVRDFADAMGRLVDCFGAHDGLLHAIHEFEDALDMFQCKVTASLQIPNDEGSYDYQEIDSDSSFERTRGGAESPLADPAVRTRVFEAGIAETPTFIGTDFGSIDYATIEQRIMAAMDEYRDEYRRQPSRLVASRETIAAVRANIERDRGTLPMIPTDSPFNSIGGMQVHVSEGITEGHIAIMTGRDPFGTRTGRIAQQAPERQEFPRAMTQLSRSPGVARGTDGWTYPAIPPDRIFDRLRDYSDSGGATPLRLRMNGHDSYATEIVLRSMSIHTETQDIGFWNSLRGRGPQTIHTVQITTHAGSVIDCSLSNVRTITPDHIVVLNRIERGQIAMQAGDPLEEWFRTGWSGGEVGF